MLILGIETSCDETAAAIVQSNGRVKAHQVVSSLKEHRAYGGIIPEIASRRQLECIFPIVKSTLEQAHCPLKNMDAIAVTTHPGLHGSLLVGVSFAQALSQALHKPYIPIDHIQSHLYANFLYEGSKPKMYPRLPAVGLIVSGGHTALYNITKWEKLTLLGETRDDAAGEAFDKVARILDLGYPGGPAIEKAALKGTSSPYHFTCAKLKDSFDFSFSGIKTAVLYHTRKHPAATQKEKNYIAYAFQKSVVQNLVEKTCAAALKKKVKTILVGGGVAANQYLRQKLTRAAQQHHIKVFFPPMKFCLDNAAMIAGLAHYRKAVRL